MSNVSTNKLSIYLIKDSYANHKDIIKGYDTLEQKEIKNGTKPIGILYFGNSHFCEPSWIKDFFGPSFNNKNEKEKNLRHEIEGENKKWKLFNASSKAVLLIKYRRKTFAIPFGYGRNLLNHGVWEERFGLKTALNIVSANNLRRIDKKNMSPIPKDTSEQLSRGGIAADFEIDVEQDLIQSITGTSKENIFGKSITGKDALSVSVKVNLAGIKKFLNNCYQKYMSDDYKKYFDWIDHIIEVKDSILITKLDDKLIENIKNEKIGKIWMAVPELVDWEDILGFSYKNNIEDVLMKNDIRLLDFLDSLSEDDKNNLSEEVLRRKKIFCISAQNDEIKYEWLAYNCLYCETNNVDNNEKTYLLSNGKWYEIEKNFSKQINKDHQKFKNHKSSLTLPPYRHDNENDYNEQTAQNDSRFCCMDKKMISYGGLTAIEFCDLLFCDFLTSDNKIIHVKRYRGSSTLSHLFSQGVVSGELFMADENFRKKVNEKLLISHKIGNIAKRQNASKYEIIFAIIYPADKELELPFFSKLNLRNAKRRLEAYGYKVVLQKIKAEEWE